MIIFFTFHLIDDFQLICSWSCQTSRTRSHIAITDRSRSPNFSRVLVFQSRERTKVLLCLTESEAWHKGSALWWLWDGSYTVKSIWWRMNRYWLPQQPSLHPFSYPVDPVQSAWKAIHIVEWLGFSVISEGWKWDERVGTRQCMRVKFTRICVV